MLFDSPGNDDGLMEYLEVDMEAAPIASWSHYGQCLAILIYAIGWMACGTKGGG